MIQCKDLYFTYPGSAFSLRFQNLTIEKGDQVVLVGPSGSGKTTLLNILAGLTKPTRGTVQIDGINLYQYSEADRRDFRIVKLGLVFQEFELLEYLTVKENILIPYHLNPIIDRDAQAFKRVEELATYVGLADKVNRYPSHLSQGERQRVALCRALVTQPQVLLCDEPTANLDPQNRDQILTLVTDYCRNNDKILIMVTHDREIRQQFDHVIDMEKTQA